MSGWPTGGTIPIAPPIRVRKRVPAADAGPAETAAANTRTARRLTARLLATRLRLRCDRAPNWHQHVTGSSRPPPRALLESVQPRLAGAPGVRTSEGRPATVPVTSNTERRVKDDRPAVAFGASLVGAARRIANRKPHRVERYCCQARCNPRRADTSDRTEGLGSGDRLGGMTRTGVSRGRPGEPSYVAPSRDSNPLGVSSRPTWIRGIVSGAELLSVMPPWVVYAIVKPAARSACSTVSLNAPNGYAK